MVVLYIVLILLIVIVIVTAVVRYYPPLGGTAGASRAYRSRMEQSTNFVNGKFMNQTPTSMEMNAKTMIGVMVEFVKGRPESKPMKPIPINRMDPLTLHHIDRTLTRVTWLGHSAIYMQISGLHIMIDPMLGKTPSPFPIFGGKRYSQQLPLSMNELPELDAVVLSHDHYDHLDYGSIEQLKHKVKMFLVPLGVGAHLERWGVAADRIKEHDWWQQSEYAGLTFTATPARHFSGRSLRDRFSTLWCSWVIDAKHTKIYFSGDSGYGGHFAEIGEKYGPFDLTFMECGQYDERWRPIHMLPEETAQAQLDVRGKLMVPIHWAAFTLALHSWTDPIERVLRAGEECKIAIATPQIGESFIVGSSAHPKSTWWRADI